MTEIQTDSMELTLEWLVRNREASVRLVNCIVASPQIAGMTLRQFLAHPTESQRLLLGVRSLGRKTAAELAELAKKAAAEFAVGLPPSAIPSEAAALEPPRKIAFRHLVSLLEPIPFPAALLKIEISTRLRNGLKQFELAQGASERWEAGISDLGIVVAKWPEIRSKLLSQANLGRKTVTELQEIIESVVNRRLKGLCALSDRTPSVKLDFLDETNMDGSVVDFLQTVGQSGNDTSIPGDDGILALIHGDAFDGSLPPREHVSKIISGLSQKEQDVILRRYGLDGRTPETLEEIASQFHVTRERVRQVEATALRRLRIGTNSRAFERLLAAEQDDVWQMLSGGNGLVMPADIQDRHHEISPAFMLAIDVVHARIVGWAASMGRTALGGWLNGPVDAQDLRDSVARLNTWAGTAPGPVPLHSVEAVIGLSDKHLAAALKLTSAVKIFEGYLCPGHLGPKMRRVCRLHKISLDIGEGKLFDCATLYKNYARSFPEDEVSSRVILQGLRDAPHLFFRIFDDIWISLSSKALTDECTPISSIPFERRDGIYKSDFEKGSIGAWLHETMLLSGPMRSIDLRAKAEIAFHKNISQSSVGAILQSNADFVRLAPGVYGLQSHVSAVSDISNPIPSSFMTDSHCRYFATSRMTGDPIDLYPAWGYHLEAAMCRWAADNTSDDVYRSLLAVSEPAKWPIDAGEQAFWTNRKRDYGGSKIPRLPLPRSQRLPAVADFLAAAIYLRMTDSIAWTTVNRTAQRRLDDQKAASTLALLVAFGMAAPMDHWQQRHLAQPRAASIVARIVADLAHTGALSWNEGTLAELRKAPVEDHLGCFELDEIATMLAGGEETADAGTMMGTANLPDLDSLFDGEDWGAAFSSESEE